MNVAELPIGVNAAIAIGSVLVVMFGAHWVVESASRIAQRLGVSELIIGLTVVALGTSAPEFSVTLVAAFKGHADISVGNIVGSNIFNLGFILGGCALIRPIPIPPILLRRDGAVIGATAVLLLVLIGWDLRLDRWDGALLFVSLIGYLAYLFRQRHEDSEEASSPEPSSGGEPAASSLPRDAALLCFALACIILGSQLLVESATTIARGFGVSEWVIGVTIVAAGTSAPEFATSLAGVIKGRHAIGAGSLIGSDIFNLLGALGLAGMLHPMDVGPMARLSLAGLAFMVFLVLILMRTGWKISRLEGFLLVVVASLRWGLDLWLGSAGA